MTRISTAVDVSAFSTDAKFRTWGSAISTSLAAAGLVKTSDTGQIDWTTVVRPTTATQVAGYEIWRFNDTLQSTAPVYFKLYYGTAGHISGQSVQVSFRIGTGSDGAGTITGPQTTTLNPPSYALGNLASTNTSMTMLFTHTEGYALVYSDSSYTGTSYGGSPLCFAIDRIRNQSTGAPTTEGIHIWYTGSNSSTLAAGYSQVISFTLKNVLDATPTATMPPGDSANYNGYLFPVYACIPRPLVCVGMIGYMTGQIAAYSTFTCKPIGTTTTHTYIALSNAGVSSLIQTASIAGLANEANIRVALLWED